VQPSGEKGRLPLADLVIAHFPENRVSLVAPMNTVFLTESLNIAVVVILRYFSDNGG
jgi:hypothetical protein